MQAEDIRKRTSEEDALLGSRTTAFLLSNGFIMAALGISEIAYERAVMAILGVAMSLIWLIVAWQSRQAITALHRLYNEHHPHDPINAAVFKSIYWERGWAGTVLGPTELLCLWLPSVVLLAWLSINFHMHF